MAAGIAMLKQLRERKAEIYPKLESFGAKLTEGLTAAGGAAKVPMTVNRVGSMFTCFFTEGPVTDWTSASKSDTAAFGRFFRGMLDAGIWLPPSQFEAAFLSAAHTDEDIQKTVLAAKTALKK
jgi:glutamate-1-semialdehyde 2,1-aminomutase